MNCSPESQFAENVQRLRSRPHLLSLAMVVGILATGLTLRGYHLSTRSIWFDEAMSWATARFSYQEIIERTAINNQPPLYFLLLRSWQSVFGESAASLRSLSVLSGGLAILGMMLFVRDAYRPSSCGGSSASRNRSRSFHWEMAMFTGALVATNILQIDWSRQVRMYATGAALAAFSHWFLVRAMRSDNHSRGPWVLYVIVTVAFAYTHYYALFSIAAQFLFLLSYVYLRLHRDGIAATSRIVARIVAAGFSILVAWLPWLPVFLERHSRVQQEFWIEPLSLWTIARTFSQMFVNPMELEPEVAGVVFVTGICAVALFVILCKSATADWLVFSAAVGPIAMAAVVSSLGTSIFLTRYFVFSNLFLLVAIARAVYCLPSEIIRRSVVGIIVVAGLSVFAFCWPVLEKWDGPGAKGVAAHLDRVRGAGEPVVISTSLHYFTCSYYAEDRENWFLFASKVAPAPVVGGPAARDTDLVFEKQLANFESDRVWTIDATGARWETPPVPVPDSWNEFGEPKAIPAVNAWFGTYVVREYRQIVTE